MPLGSQQLSGTAESGEKGMRASVHQPRASQSPWETLSKSSFSSNEREMHSLKLLSKVLPQSFVSLFVVGS